MPIFYNCVLMVEGIVQIYSGVILIKSVVSVRRFFVKNKATDYINTGMLLRHALTFGIYITTTAAYFVSFAVFTFYPDNDAIYTIVSVIGLVYIFGGIVSMLLLVNIFWYLGTNVRTKRESTSTSFLMSIADLIFVSGDPVI